MLRASVSLLVLVPALALGGCGLDAAGTAHPSERVGSHAGVGGAGGGTQTVGQGGATSGGGGSPVTGEGGTSAGGSGTGATGAGGAGGKGPCSAVASPCSAEVPPGWTRVGLTASPGDTCAEGFSALDLVESPAGVCACGPCGITLAPDCQAGSVQAYVDDWKDPACSKTASYRQAFAACTPIQGGTTLPSHYAGTPPVPSPGACAAAAASDPAGTTSSSLRACVPTVPACDGAICEGPLAECILAEGPSSCPPGPFGVRHDVGAAIDVACGACACEVTASCVGHMEYFTDGGCQTGKVSLPVDGTCVSTGADYYATFYAYRYAGGAVTACTTAPPTASATLTQPRILCCRP